MIKDVIIHSSGRDGGEATRGAMFMTRDCISRSALPQTSVIGNQGVVVLSVNIAGCILAVGAAGELRIASASARMGLLDD